MRMIYKASIYLTMLAVTVTGLAQAKATRLPTASSGARYFQLTVNLKFGANGDQQATEQTVTTEFALRGAITGSCRARMVSQTPAGSGVGTKYIEVGTKFDADDIHLEGDGVAIHFVLSASRPVKIIKYKRGDGVEVEEPMITDRTVELSIKLPLDQQKVVFDSSSKSLAPLKHLGSGSNDDPAADMPKSDQPMAVEMTVIELK